MDRNAAPQGASPRASSSLRRAAAVLALVAAVGACSSGSDSATVPSVTTEADASSTSAVRGTGSSAQTPLEEGQAFSRCMRSHGVTAWPDPEPTPGGSYGYRTDGVDPKSAAFAAAGDACKDLVPEWFSGGDDLTAAQQQDWLDWARCVRTHGMPSFADPTFPGGQAVAISSAGRTPTPQLEAAMDACSAQLPKVGGLGG
jgi:hypothetical protein